jgi:hypothetical protein
MLDDDGDKIGIGKKEKLRRVALNVTRYIFNKHNLIITAALALITIISFDSRDRSSYFYTSILILVIIVELLLLDPSKNIGRRLIVNIQKKSINNNKITDALSSDFFESVTKRYRPVSWIIAAILFIYVTSATLIPETVIDISLPLAVISFMGALFLYQFLLGLRIERGFFGNNAEEASELIGFIFSRTNSGDPPKSTRIHNDAKKNLYRHHADYKNVTGDYGA